MPPGELRRVVSYGAAHRDVAGPFDVALEGATDGDRPDRGAATIVPYVDAGLTWWVEALGWWRGDVGEARRRVRQDPSRL